MRYRKKAVTIEAIRYVEDNKDEVLAFGGDDVFPEQSSSKIIVATIDRNNAAVDIGDWLLKGAEGEFYPCKNSIFLKTYSLAFDEESAKAFKESVYKIKEDALRRGDLKCAAFILGVQKTLATLNKEHDINIYDLVVNTCKGFTQEGE